VRACVRACVRARVCVFRSRYYNFFLYEDFAGTNYIFLVHDSLCRSKTISGDNAHTNTLSTCKLLLRFRFTLNLYYCTNPLNIYEVLKDRTKQVLKFVSFAFNQLLIDKSFMCFGRPLKFISF